jgi:hypothetical protein
MKDPGKKMNPLPACQEKNFRAPPSEGEARKKYPQTVSFSKKLHAAHREEYHGDDLKKDVNAEGDLNTVLIAQEKGKISDKKKSHGTDNQVDHRRDQAAFIFPPRKVKNDHNDQVDRQHQAKC